MRKIAIALAALVAAAATAGVASAAPVLSSHFSTDAAFLSYLGGRGVTLPADELFVAQARGGNNTTNGDYEAGLHVPPNFTNAAPVGTAGQIRWGSAGAAGGNPFVGFTLSRSGNTVTFAMGGYTGSHTAAGIADLDGLGFRARSESSGNSTAVRNVALDGIALDGASLLARDGGLDFVVLEGLTGNFTLTGEASLNWALGTIPGGSRLGFQIKGLDGVTAVPEPASAALVLAALAGLALARRHRRRSAAVA